MTNWTFNNLTLYCNGIPIKEYSKIESSDKDDPEQFNDFDWKISKCGQYCCVYRDYYMRGDEPEYVHKCDFFGIQNGVPIYLYEKIRGNDYTGYVMDFLIDPSTNETVYMFNGSNNRIGIFKMSGELLHTTLLPIDINTNFINDGFFILYCCIVHSTTYKALCSVKKLLTNPNYKPPRISVDSDGKIDIVINENKSVAYDEITYDAEFMEENYPRLKDEKEQRLYAKSFNSSDNIFKKLCREDFDEKSLTKTVIQCDHPNKELLLHNEITDIRCYSGTFGTELSRYITYLTVDTFDLPFLSEMNSVYYHILNMVTGDRKLNFIDDFKINLTFKFTTKSGHTINFNFKTSINSASLDHLKEGINQIDFALASPMYIRIY